MAFTLLDSLIGKSGAHVAVDEVLKKPKKDDLPPAPPDFTDEMIWRMEQAERLNQRLGRTRQASFSTGGSLLGRAFAAPGSGSLLGGVTMHRSLLGGLT